MINSMILFNHLEYKSYHYVGKRYHYGFCCFTMVVQLYYI